MTREFSAGGVVYKKEGDQTFILLIKPRPSPDFPKERYQFPKGLIDTGEKSIEAALREVREETGVVAKIITKLTDSKIFYTFRGEKIFKIVSYFLMEYEEGDLVPQKEETEEVFWLPLSEVRAKLTYPSDKKVIDFAKKELASA